MWTTITKNKKAYFDYEILENWEAGIELNWHEVKSIREWQVNLKWSYISLRGSDLFIRSMHITPWKALVNRQSIGADNDRKIFLHKKVISYLSWKLKEKWFSIIPLELYFKWSLIKVRVWLAKWRKAYQKKQVLKERTVDREAKRAMSKYY